LGITDSIFTVGIAIIAAISGIIASIFAVSGKTKMLTDMELIPHSHFGMLGLFKNICSSILWLLPIII
jgi:hypothetical protein